MDIKLSDCPEILQKAVEEKASNYEKWFGNYQIISVAVFETTQYKDKNIITRTYRVIIMAANFFNILKYSECSGEHYNLGVSSDSVNFGEVMEIINHAPKWLGFQESTAGSSVITAVG